MLQFIQKIAVDDSGQDLIEYALVAALVGVAAASALRVLSSSVGSTFNGVDNRLTNAVPQGNPGH